MLKTFFTRITSSPQHPKKQQFTIQNFVRLGNQLIQHHTNAAKIPLIIECIRSIAEILIWSDQNGHEEFFHAFLEMKLLKYFESVLWIENTTSASRNHNDSASQVSGSVASTFSFHNGFLGKSRKRGRPTSDTLATKTTTSSVPSLPPPEDDETISTLSETSLSSSGFTKFAVAKQLLQKQLLQTLSIMIQNLSSKDSLYFILSNSYMNQFIKYRYDFHDEEVLDYYITLLKTISMRLDVATIQFFFVHDDLLLYQEAKKYMTVKESMIRIAVRTLILNIYSVASPNIREYIIDDAFLRSELVKLNQMVFDCRYSTLISSVDSSINEFQDYVYYFNDILELNIPEIKSIIEEALLRDLIVDFILPSLEHQANDEDITTGRQVGGGRDRSISGGAGGKGPLMLTPKEERRWQNGGDLDLGKEVNLDADANARTHPDSADHSNLAPPPPSSIPTPSPQSSPHTPNLKLNGVSHTTSTPSPLRSPRSRFTKRLSPEEYHIRRTIQQAIILVEGRQHFRALDQDFTEEDIIQWYNQTKLIDSKIALLALGQIFLVFNSHPESKSILAKLENILLEHPKSELYKEILKGCFSLHSDVPLLSAGASFVFILSNSASPDFLKSWGLLPKRRERELKQQSMLDILSGEESHDETANEGISVDEESVEQPHNVTSIASSTPSLSSPSESQSPLPNASTSPQSAPPSSSVSSLITAILLRLSNRHTTPKRLITIHLLCQLCYELTKLTTSNISVASRTKVRVSVTEEHLRLIWAAVELSRKLVLKHIGHDVLDLLPVFESEYTKYQQIRNFPWDRLCGDAALIVEDVTSHLEYHRREPTSAVEEIRVNVHTYLALQNLFFIFKSGTSQSFNVLLNELIDSYPQTHRIGQDIPFTDPNMCKGDFLIKNKRKDKRKLFERRHIFFDQNNFLVTLSSTVRNGQVIVRSVTPLRHIRTRQHSKNANAMHLFAFTDRNAPMLRDIIVFGNPQKRQDVQNIIEDAVAKCLQEKAKILEKIIHVNAEYIDGDEGEGEGEG
eukprot:CAMPEP_0117449126 /NCGR_PEP_ID=MMETSP0759-20121206/7778_1 /TAXON_ID=63605 /ORGANISM="Percolomonas cosmopolitus, Strain WS" /LENGTH=1022 /DNA_ID=CAMNT_0005241579 /DNA_START=341 /DNA_END=3410 /DNA_ORIENTATION=+